MGFWEKVLIVALSPIIIPVGVGIAIKEAVSGNGDSKDTEAAEAQEQAAKARADALRAAREQEETDIVQYASRELAAVIARHGLKSKAGLRTLSLEQLELLVSSPALPGGLMAKLRDISPGLRDTNAEAVKAQSVRLTREIDELVRLRQALLEDAFLNGDAGAVA